MSKDDSNGFAALGLALGTMGLGRGGNDETRKAADEVCLEEMKTLERAMEALGEIVHDASENGFEHSHLVEILERMTSLATATSTLRMSIGLGTPPIFGAGLMDGLNGKSGN